MKGTILRGGVVADIASMRIPLPTFLGRESMVTKLMLCLSPTFLGQERLVTDLMLSLLPMFPCEEILVIDLM